jgi:hypothetical protein
LANIALATFIEEIAAIRGAALAGNAARTVNVFISVKEALSYLLKYAASQ